MRKTIHKAIGGDALLRAGALLACALALLAVFGQAACAATATGSPAAFPTAIAPFAIADFDGDNQPDLATVQAGQISPSRTRYWIRFQLSTGARQDINVTAPAGGLEIASRDVNGDNALDLVVTTAWLRQPVAVLLNDGHGHFTNADPGAFAWIWGEPWSWNSPLSLDERGVVAPTQSFSGDAGDARFVCQTPPSAERFATTASEIPLSLERGPNLGRAPPPSVSFV